MAHGFYRHSRKIHSPRPFWAASSLTTRHVRLTRDSSIRPFYFLINRQPALPFSNSLNMTPAQRVLAIPKLLENIYSTHQSEIFSFLNQHVNRRSKVSPRPLRSYNERRLSIPQICTAKATCLGNKVGAVIARLDERRAGREDSVEGFRPFEEKLVWWSR